MIAQRDPVIDTTYMLLPLPEPGLLRLDLLREPLAKRLLLLLELGVVELLDLGFTVLPRLHLLLTVVLVMEFLGRVDQVEHVRADQEGAEFLEVAVVLILNCGEMD